MVHMDYSSGLFPYQLYLKAACCADRNNNKMQIQKFLLFIRSFMNTVPLLLSNKSKASI